MLAFNKGWYLLYTSSRQERKVSSQLATMKISHYLPMTKSARKWADRTKVIITPLFPSYLFIYLEQIQDYYAGLNTEGVLHYVKFGTQIVRIPESIISDLKILSNYTDPIKVSMLEFRKGESLIITKGPLNGLNCEVIKYNNKEMILVRISLLKRNLLLELPICHLSKL